MRTWADVVRTSSQVVVVAQSSRVPSLAGKVPNVVTLARRGVGEIDTASWCTWGQSPEFVSVCVVFSKEAVRHFPYRINKIGWSNVTKFLRWCSPSGCRLSGRILNLPVDALGSMEEICQQEMMAGVVNRKAFLSSVSVPQGDGNGMYTLSAFCLGASGENIQDAAALMDTWLTQSRGNEGWIISLSTSDEKINVCAVRVLVGEVCQIEGIISSGSPFVTIPSISEEAAAGAEIAKKVEDGSVIGVGETARGKVYAFVDALAKRPGIRVRVEQRKGLFASASPIVYIVRETLEVCRAMGEEHAGIVELLEEAVVAQRGGGETV